MTLPSMQLSAADRTRLEHFLLDFDQNWTEQHLGIMVGQLASESQEYRAVALTELVKIELDHRQQRGDAVEIDPYLERFSELKESDHLVADLLQAEIELRNDAGNLPSATELKQRFPALQSRIDSMLAEAASNLEASRVRRAKRKHLKEETQSSGSTTSLATAAQETLPPGPRKPSEPAKSDGLEGDQFGRYRLLRELGRGAMGTVYLAEDTELRRQVAIKRPRLAGTEEASMMERFYREAYAAATLDHPNICPVYDIGTHEGIPFITMAYVDGKPLSKVIRESERLNPRAVASLVRKIAVALAEAHAKGVIHRDLKPGNIMLNHRNEPIVMDFGLARQVGHADDRLTADGTLIGTPGYMSPEQVEGDLNAVGCPSDIYSLGVVLFELLTGELPFRGSVTSVIGQILRDDSPTPSSLRAELPKELDDICMKMMAKAPTDRFASMSEVSRALAVFIKSSGDSATVASPPQIEELTIARLEAQKNEITQQIAGGNWREASLQLQRMCELTEPIAAPYVRWATERSTALHARWQQEQQASVQSISTAKEQFATQDYVAAAQTLLAIDKQLLTGEGKQLLAESLKLQEEVDLLIHLIEQGLSTGKQPGMVKNLQRLMALKSKDPLARDLYRKYRWQQRLGWFGATMADAFSLATPSRMRSWNDEPMLRKWFAFAALVFCISFGLMSWAVVIYLRGPNQTLAIEVADELVTSGGITLAVDGDDHIITGRDFELKVALGPHGFSVRQGDTVVHNPQTFTIEKEGRQILYIEAQSMSLGRAPHASESLANKQAEDGQSQPDLNESDAAPFDNVAMVPELSTQRFELSFDSQVKHVCARDGDLFVLWDEGISRHSATGQEKSVIKTNGSCVAFDVSLDAKRICTVRGNDIEVWDVDKGAFLSDIEIPRRDEHELQYAIDADWDSKAEHILVAYVAYPPGAIGKRPPDRFAYLANMRTHNIREVFEFEGKLGGYMTEINYCEATNSYFATDAYNERSRLYEYDLDTNAVRFGEYDHTGRSLAIGKQQVFMGSWTGPTIVVDRSTLRKVSMLPSRGQNDVLRMCVSEDQSLLAAYGKKNTGEARIVIYDTQSLEPWRSIPVPGTNLGSIVLSKKGNFIAYKLHGDELANTVFVHQLDDRAKVSDTNGTAVDEKLPATGSASREHNSFNADASAFPEAISWPAVTNAARTPLPDGPPGLVKTLPWEPYKRLPVRRIAISSDGQTVAAGGPTGSGIWDLTSGKSFDQYKGRGANSVAFSPDGKSLYAHAGRGIINRHDAPTFEKVCTFAAVDGDLFSLSVSADGTSVVGHVNGQGLCFWNTATGKLENQLQDSSEFWGEDVSFIPGARHVLTSGSEEVGIRLIDSETVQSIRQYRFAEKPMINTSHLLSVSPDGRLFMATPDFTGRVTVVDVKSGRIVTDMSFSNGRIGGTAFLLDGKHVLTGVGLSLVIWNPTTRREIHRFEMSVDKPSDTAWLGSVAVSPDGRFAIGAAMTYSVKDYPANFDDIHVWRLPEEVWPKLDSQTNSGDGGEQSRLGLAPE